MSEPPVTELLALARDGDRTAVSRLVSVLHDELRQLASAQMRHEREGHTLQTTALVNEAYIRLVDQNHSDWENRRHFLAAAAQAMRRILLQHARDRGRQKRGGGWKRVPDIDGALQIPEPNVDVLALDEALEKLQTIDPEKVRLVELRYFAGLTIEEAAKVLGVSPATLKRDWQVARAWLFRELQEEES
ncbi:MAG: sigma-70 family RNA polymerase sigma factor [Phycisphaerales bacterium]|nr:sigma-70 family RNA polymerase sigma factor [Phycisphaerales bacterium]